MSIITPKSLTETIGAEALRKKVEEEIGLSELIPKTLPVPIPFNYTSFQAIIPRIDGIGIKCQDTIRYIYKPDLLFDRYLADYIGLQMRIDKIVSSEHDLYHRSIQQTNRFNQIRQYLTPSGALLWLFHAIPRPILTSYGYITYFISEDPRFQPLVTNHQQLLRRIFTNAHDIVPKLVNRYAIEHYIQQFVNEARMLRDRQYRTDSETSSEIYYNYILKHFVMGKPLNIPILHNYMSRYEQIVPRKTAKSTKPAAKQYTRRGSLQPVLPSLIPPTYPTSRATLKRRSAALTLTTPTLPVIKVNAPRPSQRRNTRRVRSPITTRPVQVAPGYRPPSPYYSPVTNGSPSSANSFVTARGN